MIYLYTDLYNCIYLLVLVFHRVLRDYRLLLLSLFLCYRDCFLVALLFPLPTSSSSPPHSTPVASGDDFMAKLEAAMLVEQQHGAAAVFKRRGLARSPQSVPAEAASAADTDAETPSAPPV